MTRTIFVFGSNLAGRHAKGARVRPWVHSPGTPLMPLTKPSVPPTPCTHCSPSL